VWPSLARLGLGLHGTRVPRLAGPASACTARDCAALRASAHQSGATVAEVEQGEVLKHPRRRGHPPGKWVEAVAHQSFLPMGREKKTGTTAAFFDEVGAPVAGGVLCRGGEGEEAHAQVKLEKRRQGGGGCSGLRSPEGLVPQRRE
jgi:hypothetical protein